MNKLYHLTAVDLGILIESKCHKCSIYYNMLPIYHSGELATTNITSRLLMSKQPKIDEFECVWVLQLLVIW